ncbi:patatin-like phospholipase family protein [Aquabacterium sp. OR-4]|uniref:patatin-like phospholipase family protein n=1 Tax=Aquabacterium sp. OR-4 TaxID=2978127 RepID=UPI0021B382A8
MGLALAGGGPLGATWEIGALCAIEDALPGIDLVALQGYVGVSAGGFIAAALANGMRPRQLCAAFIENDTPLPDDEISPALFVRPAFGEWFERLAMLPALLAQAGTRLLLNRRSLTAAVERLGAVLPTGLFGNQALEARLQRMFTQAGRSDDFRHLRQRGRHLVLVATDLDSGEVAPFGLPGWDAVPISRAVAASAALPGLFPPVQIAGRHYVDGALKKTLHASVLLDQGLDLLIALNPIVPFDATHALPAQARGRAGERIPHLVDGGLPLVLSQTFRALIHSRLQLGLKGYERSHPHTDIVLFEPDQRDPEMFLANIFSYSQRRHLAEHAYQKTRADLRARRDLLGRLLARHGLQLDEAALDDPARRLLLRQPPPRPRRWHSRLSRSLSRLDKVLDTLEQRLAAG